MVGDHITLLYCRMQVRVSVTAFFGPRSYAHSSARNRQRQCGTLNNEVSKAAMSLTAGPCIQARLQAKVESTHLSGSQRLANSGDVRVVPRVVVHDDSPVA